MIRQFLAAVLVLAAGLAGAARAQDDDAQRFEPSDSAPRGVSCEWTSAEGVTFRYLIPRSYTRERGATLLVMLHGSNLDRRWAFANFAPAKFRRDDVILAPDGTTPNGKGGFNETAGACGVRNSGWGWGGTFLDYDNDGREDVYVLNGFISGPDTQDL